MKGRSPSPWLVVCVLPSRLLPHVLSRTLCTWALGASDDGGILTTGGSQRGTGRGTEWPCPEKGLALGSRSSALAFARAWVCTHVQVCTRAHTCECMCTCTLTRACACMCPCMHTSVHVHAHVCLCVRACVWLCAHGCLPACVRLRARCRWSVGWLLPRELLQMVT